MPHHRQFAPASERGACKTACTTDGGVDSDLRAIGPVALCEHDVTRVIYGGTKPTFAVCVECARVSGPYWIKWRACRIDSPELEELPEIAMYCPACAHREFGPPRRRRLGERRREPRG